MVGTAQAPFPTLRSQRSQQPHKRPSYSAKAEYPVRRGFSFQSLMSLEYWVTRRSLSSGRPKAGPVGG